LLDALNFRLRRTSHIIDKGSDGHSTRDDFLGTVRPVGEEVDPGAFEGMPDIEASDRED
jgi:hypothetical protein